MAKKNDTITLLQYDKTNTLTTGRTAVARLGIARNGAFVFNPTATSLLKAKDGSQLVFLQDENSPSDWYVRFVGKDGFEVRLDKGGRALINSAVLKEKLFESIGYTYESGTMHVGEQLEGPDGKAMWPLITSSI